MPSRFRTGILLTLIFLVAPSLVVLGVVLGRNTAQGVDRGAPEVHPPEIEGLLHEINELTRRLDSQSHQETEQGKAELEETRHRLAEVVKRVDQLSTEMDYKDYLTEANSRLTSQSLTLATIFVTLVAVLFTAFAATIGYLGHRQLEEVKDLASGLPIKEIRQSIKDQANFVEQVADKFFSDTLRELLHAMEKAEVLESRVSQDLSRKINEVQARLDLWSSAPTRIMQACSTLTAIGTRPAILDLKRLQEQPQSPKEVRDAAFQAITAIQRRHPPAPPGGSNQGGSMG